MLLNNDHFYFDENIGLYMYIPDTQEIKFYSYNKANTFKFGIDPAPAFEFEDRFENYLLDVLKFTGHYKFNKPPVTRFFAAQKGKEEVKQNSQSQNIYLLLENSDLRFYFKTFYKKYRPIMNNTQQKQTTPKEKNENDKYKEEHKKIISKGFDYIVANISFSAPTYDNPTHYNMCIFRINWTNSEIIFFIDVKNVTDKIGDYMFPKAIKTYKYDTQHRQFFAPVSIIRIKRYDALSQQNIMAHNKFKILPTIHDFGILVDSVQPSKKSTIPSTKTHIPIKNAQQDIINLVKDAFKIGLSTNKDELLILLNSFNTSYFIKDLYTQASNLFTETHSLFTNATVTTSNTFTNVSKDLQAAEDENEYKFTRTPNFPHTTKVSVKLQLNNNGSEQVLLNQRLIYFLTHLQIVMM